MTIQIDPELQALIPALTTEERKQLEVSLKAEGCLDPLRVWKEQGILLDGHHRFEICTREQLKFQTIEISCADRDDAKAWIIRNQFGRRNLQPFQRAELALQLKPLLALEAKRRQAAMLNRNGRSAKSVVRMNSSTRQKSKKTTREKLGEAAGVSEQTIQRSAVIKAHATPEVQQALREGKTTINREYQNIKKTNGQEPVFDGRRVLQEIEQHITKEFAACTVVWRIRFLEHGRLLYERLAKAENARRAHSPGVTITFNAAPRKRAQ